MKRKSVVIMLIFILNISFLIPQIIKGDVEGEIVGDLKLAYANHGPIIITTNADLTSLIGI